MIANLTETIKVPASFLVDMKAVSDEVKKDLSAFIQLPETDENKASERTRIVALISPKVSGQLAAIGAQLPTDVIDLSMKLGDFLYSMYQSHVRPAQAPLALKRHEKRLMELAEILSLDEFNVPPSIKEAIEPILMDESKWKETNFQAFVMVVDQEGKPQPNYIGLTAMGAAFFSKILSAVVEVFEPAPKTGLKAVPAEGEVAAPGA